MIPGPRLAALLPSAFLLAGGRAQSWFEAHLEGAEDLPPATLLSSLFAGAFVSEDLTCISAGVLVAQEILPFTLAALACALGVWTSDSLLYFLGFLARCGLLERAPLRWIARRDRVEGIGDRFARYGGKLLLLSRFMPGSRVPIYVGAGFLAYPYRRFAGWMALASALWAPVMVALSRWLGEAMLRWLEVYETAAWIAVPAVVLVVWILLRGIEALIAKMSRSTPERDPED